MTAVGVGWYADPQNAARMRFWDGTAWGAERVWDGASWVSIHNADRPVPPAAPYAMPRQGAPGPPWQSGPPPVWPAATGAAPAHAGVSARVRTRAFIVCGGVAVMLLGAVLPWASQDYGFETISIDGSSTGGGKVSIFLALAIALFTALLLAGRLSPIKTGIIDISVAVVAAAICLANITNVSDVIKQEKVRGITDSGVGTSVGPGLGILLLGEGIVIVAAILIVIAGRHRPALRR